MQKDTAEGVIFACDIAMKEARGGKHFFHCILKMLCGRIIVGKKKFLRRDFRAIASEASVTCHNRFAKSIIADRHMKLDEKFL